MRCLVVSCVYPPEPVVSAQTSAQIAENLKQKGHEVRVITSFPNRPGGKIYPGHARGLFQYLKRPDGFELIRCFSVLSPESRLFTRFLENVTFGLTSGWVVLTSKKPDVIYSNSWPIFATGIIWAIAGLRKIPLVIYVQDMYPESLSVHGRIPTHRWTLNFFRWVDGIIARGSQAVIVISERFAEVYRRDRKVSAEHIYVVPNWVEGNALIIKRADNPIRKEHSIPEEAFLLVYGGNIGEVAGVEAVIEAFRCLSHLPSVYLLIAGDGTNLANCQKLANEIASGKIFFHTPWRNDYKVLSAADVLILPTRGKQSLNSVPSKLLAYLLAARPVLAAVLPESDTAQIIEKAGCGWIIPPDNTDLIANKIEELAKLPEQLLAQMGSAGRQYALENLTAETCLPKMIDILERVAV